MGNTETKSIEDFVNPKPKVSNWPAFVEADAVNFFNLHEIEKMSIEDGTGNKAKLARQKDESIKVEYSTTTIL